MNESKPDITYLKHIAECCENIFDFTSDYSENDFLKDKKTQDAVIRNFEIIGEATKKLSEDFRKNNPGIEWKRIAGLRDKLIHDYMGIDLWSVFALLKNTLPDFYSQINSIIRDTNN